MKREPLDAQAFLRVLILPYLILILVFAGATATEAFAAPLTASEIRKEMLGHTIVTRRFGMKVAMRYRSNGTVSAKALLGSSTGTWRARGNRICTTFPSGPAKGTSCVSFIRTGPKRYKSSEGVSFSVVD